MVRVQPTPSGSGGNRKRIKYARSPQVALAVTQDLIDKSLQRDSSHCMIAEAVKQAVPGARYVSVDLQTIRFTDPVKALRYTYLTPRLAQVSLVNFDQGKELNPFSVRLRGGAVTQSQVRNKDKPEKIGDGVVAKKKTIMNQRHANPKTSIPEVSGGKTPPIGSLASITTARGRRRTYGLRALDM